LIETSAFVVTFLLALGLALCVTPVMMALGQRMGIVTKVTARRTNEGDTRALSKLGSGTLFVSFTLTVLLAQLLDVPRFDPNEVSRLTGLLIGCGVIFVIGIIDDWLELSPRTLLIGQIAAALIAIHFDIFIEGFNNPLSGGEDTKCSFHHSTCGLSL
jgi:UDP-GlcNAc:undecaprenyl-phosphate GlcNAc-1-phosphate transferase